MKLAQDQVVFHPFSYGDWTGRVFWWQGGIYRAISSERAPFYERLLSEGVLHDLMRRQLLIDTEIAALEIDGYALVLKHRTIPFVSHCYEWCGEMLKAAALSVLELERELLKHGLTLQDAHPYNVLFDGPTPTWVDLGSVVPMSPGEPWHAYEELLAFYTRPLKIMAAGHAHIARCLLRDAESGIRQRDLEAITGNCLARARAGVKAFAGKAVPTKLRPFVRRPVRSLSQPPPLTEKKRLTTSIEGAMREIESIRLVDPASNAGGGDRYDSATATNCTTRQRRVAQILSAKAPRSVLDIGSNGGWYSQLSARTGARVVSVDRNETLVTKVFFDAVRGQLPILPLVADFRNLNPMMAWAAAPGQAYVDRLRCDMVLALSLVHHLVFDQSLNFELITRGLSAFARQCLAVEFIGRDDRYVRERLSHRFSWYSLDNFLTALKREFRAVKQISSNDEDRWVLLCER
jgi:SAM-dependent methyltransferase